MLSTVHWELGVLCDSMTVRHQAGSIQIAIVLGSQGHFQVGPSPLHHAVKLNCTGAKVQPHAAGHEVQPHAAGHEVASHNVLQLWCLCSAAMTSLVESSIVFDMCVCVCMCVCSRQVWITSY